jgi:uncharacterized membrane protein
MTSRLSFLVKFSILVVIEAIFCFTPLGSLPALGPIVATLAMVPVIVTALILGTKAGAAMGAIAGLFSFIVWTFMPPVPPVAFVFTPFYALGDMQGSVGSLIIVFIPRILVGAVAGGLYQVLSRVYRKKDALNMAISSVAGSLVNTFGVMGGIWLFFGAQYSATLNQSMLWIIGITVLSNGIPEAIVAGIIAPVVSRRVKMS